MNDTTKGSFWINAEIPDFNESELKKEFTDAEYSCIYERLFRRFHGKSLSDRGVKKLIWNYDDFENFFGLPYTSSGVFAAVWNTNADYVILDKYHLQGFALTNDLRIVALASNDDEQYKYFNLGNLYEFRTEAK